MAAVLMSFFTYMRFAHRHGPRTRWQDTEGRWHVRGRVERFLEPALLLLLAERPAHGYELVERVQELIPGERPELGGPFPAPSPLRDYRIRHSAASPSMAGPRCAASSSAMRTTRPRSGCGHTIKDS